MLEELKKYNEIGQKRDILYFLQHVIGNQHQTHADIKSICAHVMGNYILNVDALLSFCSIFQLTEESEKVYIKSSVIPFLSDEKKLSDFIVSTIIENLFLNGVLNEMQFTFDLLSKKYRFYNEKLDLTWSNIRNVLISFGFFNLERTLYSTKFYISSEYEVLLKPHIIKRKRSMSLEQLKRQLEENEKAGDLAEKYVLLYEQHRINDFEKSKNIKIISAIDVGAGYDIISFNTISSPDYDRFIEVKAVSAGWSFFWSRNEKEIAQLHGDKYYLYLVELSKISETYEPLIIQNPAKVMFEKNNWYIEPQSYQIRSAFPLENDSK
ncbi:DUF3883 domain-containing protein [Caproicibacter sp.]|uniref:DUF3883 domain-containing protein n=1 Tax=Caproicibacter sp. TaxID=2814884 RepID=UPI0039896905